MRAVVVTNPGGPDALELKSVPDPLPGPGQVAIDTQYAACNWMDTQKRRGVYPDKDFTYPTILGNEVSGVVSEVGSDVADIRIGDRVSAIVRSGGYAEKVVADQSLTISLPDDLDFATAAQFPIVCLTAYHLTHTASRLRRGETVLVHAIGGAVGLAVTQIARELGARVIGTVTSSPEKAKAAIDLGADLVIIRDEMDFVAEVMRFTDGRGVDLCIDSLGGETGYRSFDALRYYGRLINIGEAEGWPVQGLRDKLYERSTSFAGFETIHAGPGSRIWNEGVDFVVQRIRDRRIRMPLAGIFALQDVQAMHRKIESRAVSGKLLLRISP